MVLLTGSICSSASPNEFPDERQQRDEPVATGAGSLRAARNHRGTTRTGQRWALLTQNAAGQTELSPGEKHFARRLRNSHPLRDFGFWCEQRHVYPQVRPKHRLPLPTLSHAYPGADPATRGLGGRVC